MVVIGTFAGWIVMFGSRKLAGPFLSEQQARQWIKERVVGWELTHG